MFSIILANSFPLLIGLPGGPELVVIVLIVLLFFGAKRIPELARGLGRGLHEFRRAADDIKKEIDSGTSSAEDDEKTDDNESKK
jgi:sec-independent protein translocase protein TatA